MVDSNILFCNRVFAFAYMIEGASGFGTPVALGAPMLVSSGHDPVKSVVTLLVMNTFATVWGAIGTPIWFGFGSLFSVEEQKDTFIEISYKAGVCLIICAYLLVPLLLHIICPWPLIRKNLLFVLLSITTVVGPSFGLSFVTEEFPSMIGGMVGCLGTAVLIKFKVGLRQLEDPEDGDNLEIGSVSEQNEKPISESKQSGETDEDEVVNSEYGKENNTEEDGSSGASNEDDHKKVNTPDDLLAGSQQEMLERALGPRKEVGKGYVTELLCRTSPLWLVVLLLVLSRVEDIGLKDYLTRKEPNFAIYFGSYGTFRLSASLVLQLYNILSYPGLNWKFELLYIPFIMPFVLVSLFTMLVYRKDLQRSPKQIAGIVARRLKNPAIALLGALCLVQMLLRIDTAAPAYILGTVLADWFQEGFIVITPLLGALGSFFSGSTTVSNLTFGTIQKLAAESIGISPTAVLALQAVGGSAGNGICLNNIIAGCAVVGVTVGEGAILKQTYKFVFGITTISTV
eukprot:scaffold26288_cov132-Cylindrotheca_fusiformis.AAC.2